MYDLKIRNAKILELDSNQETICNIGIKDGAISCIGYCPESSREEIDAKGSIVSPGFIDIHMHEETLKSYKISSPYDISHSMLLMGVTTCVAGNCGINKQSLEDFVEFINHNGAPTNYMSFVGHNYLRNVVGNINPYNKSSAIQIDDMKRLVIKAVEGGALGVSFGLEYSPGTDLEEVFQLCSAVDDRNMLLSAHYRKDARYAVQSLNELIQISTATNFPMQISHIGSCCAYGMMQECLDIIKQAIDHGIDLSIDCYPYDAFGTYIGSAVFDEGCFELWNKSYDSILLTEGEYRGIRCDKDLFYQMRSEYPEIEVITFVMNEDEVIQAIQSPLVMVASDGFFKNGQGHPRGAGTFPRVLGRYVRENQYLTLVDALKKMTSMPAKRLGLSNKGEVTEGFDADLVIFNPDTINDLATFEEPKTPPVGIDYVIVNGEIAVQKGVILNDRLGRYIPANLSSRS
ncbi:N-acyl-D-amino-acid deacylase family protein [Natronincola peptidivorans]|nr:amidohydrolase family protein [Natronincola peptidivorans]